MEKLSQKVFNDVATDSLIGVLQSGRDKDLAKEVCRLLGEGANPKAKDAGGWSALILAIRRGNKKCVEMLIPLSDLWAKGSRGVMAIHEAVEQGNTEILGVLADAYEAKVAHSKPREWINAYASTQMTPLMIAASLGVHKVVALLLTRGADPKMVSTEGLDALSYAVRSNDQECIKDLLPLGDIGRVDHNGKGLAHVCAEDEEILELVLDAGAPCSPDKYGETPLMIAASAGSDDCVRLLLGHSDPWMVDKDGMTAFYKAAASEDDSFHIDCMQMLLDAMKETASSTRVLREMSMALGAVLQVDSGSERRKWLDERIHALMESIEIGESAPKASGNTRAAGRRRSL